MTQDEIRAKMNALMIKEEKIALKMIKLQNKCEHPNVNKKYRSNTGNYDPTADSYWIEYDCLDCDRRWSEDQ